MKKTITFAILLVIIISVVGFSSSDYYTDIKTNPYKTVINRAYKLDLLQFDSSKFYPSKMVTRQELAKSLVITYDASNSEMNRIKTITAVYPSTCTIKTDKTYGSGVAIAENQILTAYHVIKNNGVIKITMYGDIELIGRVIKISEVFDLALIEVDYKLIPIQFAASVQVGQSSIAFGCPNGLKNTVTCGIVSNVSRNIEGIYQTFIQIDTPINQGNSGGAVVDTQAKLIGIANCKISGNIDGLAFIVPFSSINIFLNDK